MKIKNSNSKTKIKTELDRELNWNNRFKIMEEKPNYIYKTDNYNYLKPKNLRLETNHKNKIINKKNSKLKKANKTSLMNSKSYKILKKNQTPEKNQTQKKVLVIKNPLYDKIKDLWNKLGINKLYQLLFNNFCLKLPYKYIEGFLNYEINHLSLIYNILFDINSNIEKRKNIISTIKQLNIDLEKNENLNQIIQNIISLLNELRIISVLIVENYIKLREQIGYDLYVNKFENNRINFYYKDYLIQIKNDTDFLASSNLSKFFSFANEGDPFLTSISNNNDSEKYISISIDENLFERIKKCQYILLNEMLTNELIKNNSKDINYNSNYSLPTSKSNSKLNKSFDSNNYIKNNKKLRFPSLKKETIISIKSYNYNKKNYTIKKQIPINNILSKGKSNNYKSIRTPSLKKGKYEESKNEYKKENSKEKIDFICQRKKNDFNHRINEKIKNKNHYKKINLSSNKDDSLISDDYINKTMFNHKIENFSKNSSSKNDYSSVQTYTYNNNENNSDNLSKNEEEEKNLISNFIKNNSDKNFQIKEKYPLIIELYSGKISDFINLYNNIIKQIPEEQKIGFQINNNLYFHLKGVYPKILLIKEFNNIKGLSIISYDPFQSCKSIKILLICTIDPLIFSSSLKQLINFINENLEYDEIKLDLFYGKKNNQFYLIESLEKKIKEDAKFKWINMENDGKDRKIKYKYSNPNLSPESILYQTSKNVIELKTACIISLHSLNDILENTTRKMNELNNFGIMSIIEELILHYNFKIEDNNVNSKFLEFLKNLKPNKFKKMTNDFVQNLYGNSNNIISFIKENLDELSNEIYPDILNNDYLGVSLMKIECSFENIIQTKINGYFYNIIYSENIEIFTYDRNENEYFYFIRSTNDNLAFIIYELNEYSSLNNLINMNSEQDNIYDEFQRIYKNMNNQNSKSMKRIFIPSFKIEKSNFHKKPSFLNAIQLSNNEDNYQITYLNQVEKFNFSIEKSKTGKNKLLFDNLNDNSDIIIKNKFLMVIINTDLLCDLQIPTVSSFVVEKNLWERE